MATINLFEMDDAFKTVRDLPHPQWEVIDEWIRNQPKADIKENWLEAQVQWLGKLQESLGEPYEILESDHFLLLTPGGEEAEAIGAFVEQSRGMILQAVQPIATDPPVGKCVILRFATEETYCQYQAAYLPEGEAPLSFAELLHPPGPIWCQHLVITDEILGNVQLSCAELLPGFYLARLPLPQWLTFAIGRSIVDFAAARPSSSLFFDGGARPEQELLEFKQFWRENGVQGFWNGKLFEGGVDFFHCARLATLLFGMIREAGEAEAIDFVEHAHREDAGQGSARKYLGQSLGELVGAILGEGSWEPDPSAWEQPDPQTP